MKCYSHSQLIKVNKILIILLNIFAIQLGMAFEIEKLERELKQKDDEIKKVQGQIN